MLKGNRQAVHGLKKVKGDSLCFFIIFLQFFFFFFFKVFVHVTDLKS